VCIPLACVVLGVLSLPMACSVRQAIVRFLLSRLGSLFFVAAVSLAVGMVDGC